MKSVLIELFAREKVKMGAIDFIFCNDEYLLQINQQFLNHNDYTDIITFDLTEAGPKLGEIYISVERVTENAQSLGLTREDELRRVMFHGCLHLCGYKDKLNDDKVLMRQKEDEYLRLYKKRST